MALKITLKPHERFILGGAAITNGEARSTFVLENDVPVLREKDIMTLKAADTPCKKIYFAVQLMYVDGKNLPEHHKTYWELVRQVAQAAPSQTELLQEISTNILQDRFYQALKLTKKLIEYETEVVSRVRSSTTRSLQNSTKRK